MTTAVETSIDRVIEPSGHPLARKRPLPARLRNALFAEWAKLSPTLDWECTEREARIRFANQVLKRKNSEVRSQKNPEPRVPISSWSDLTQGEAKRLLREMKERSGSNANYRATFIARLAVELFGPDWNEVLRERLRQRFGVQHSTFSIQTSPLLSLSPAEAHEMIEELLSRIARRDGVDIEMVRARFARKKGAGINPAPNRLEAAPARDGRAERPTERERTA